MDTLFQANKDNVSISLSQKIGESSFKYPASVLDKSTRELWEITSGLILSEGKIPSYASWWERKANDASM